MADRYTYLPLVGASIAFVWGTADLAGLRRGGRLLPAAATCLLLVCCLLTGIQVRTWTNTETLFQHALAVTGENYLAHSKLGQVSLQRGKTAEAIDHYQETLRLVPDQAEPLNNMAWIRAAHPDSTFRDGARAVELARHAVEISGDNATMLDTLAAALAEAGRFDEALATEHRAIARARGTLPDASVAAMQKRTELYAARHAYRDLKLTGNP